MPRQAVPHALGAKRTTRERVRGHYNGWFPDMLSVYRPTRTAQRGFGSSVVYNLLGIWPANHWAIGGREALIAQRLDVKAEVMVSGPHDMDLNALDEIVYHIAETGEVHHYAVTFVHNGSRELTQNAMCIEYPLAPSQVSNL